jgi:hypothetical protein
MSENGGDTDSSSSGVSSLIVLHILIRIGVTTAGSYRGTLQVIPTTYEGHDDTYNSRNEGCDLVGCP